MFCHFDPDKATQAAAVVMRYHGKRISRLRLLKLLYIADRTALRKRGHLIIGGKIVAMNNGPLHSPVYDLIKGTHLDEPRWSRFITTNGPRDLILSEEPGIELLSTYEIDLLNATCELHEQFDDFELSQLTHKFPEFAKHFEEGTSQPIPMETVVEAVYDDPDERTEVLQELKDKAVVDGILARSAT